MSTHAKVFTKDTPCTKFEIWHCFRGPTGFRWVPVVSAEAQIGKNVPRVMERAGRLVKVTNDTSQYYALTEEGRNWLMRGFKSYLKNHPADVERSMYLPRSWGY